MSEIQFEQDGLNDVKQTDGPIVDSSIKGFTSFWDDDELREIPARKDIIDDSGSKFNTTFVDFL